jgi:hypothetical protein
MKRFQKTKWGCCEGHEDELLDQGYQVPHTDMSDRQIILKVIDRNSSLALICLRAATNEEHGYCKGFDRGSGLSHAQVAADLAVEIGIASNICRSAERLKHFREWGGRVRRGPRETSNAPKGEQEQTEITEVSVPSVSSCSNYGGAGGELFGESPNRATESVALPREAS